MFVLHCALRIPLDDAQARCSGKLVEVQVEDHLSTVFSDWAHYTGLFSTPSYTLQPVEQFYEEEVSAWIGQFRAEMAHQATAS